MHRFFSCFCLLVLMFFLSGHDIARADGNAAQGSATLAAEMPVVSFAQQVDIVVRVKRDPRVLDMRIRQDNADLFLDLVIDQSQDREAAKDIALYAVMIAKSYALDDKPENDKEPGEGLYHYHLSITRPDGVVLVVANKKKDDKILMFGNPVPVLAPLTRAGAAAR